MPKSVKKSASSKKISQTKKTSTPRKGRSKAKKPKVTLAKNKVAFFCALVSGICVLSLALSVILSTEPKSAQNEKAQSVAQAELKPQPTKQAAQPKTEKTDSKQNEKKAPPQAQAEKSAVQNQSLKQAESAKQEEGAKSSSNAKIAINEIKESSPVKTIPQNLASQDGSVRKIQPSNAVATSAAPKAQAPQKTQAQVAAKAVKAQKPSQNQIASAKTPRESETTQNQVPKNRFDIPPASNGATVVIVIDDAGRSVENTKRYCALPFPITIAVLPKLPQSRACADAIRTAGKEVILPQPMQSMNLNLDPGPGKITADMSTYEIAQIVKENLLSLGPGVRGMNNHEGSQVTANVIKIGAVLEVCNEMGVYFLDSRTTAATQAPQAALERDMKIFEKAGPYLDNDIDRAKMLERMRETLAYANRHGRAIVIGHVDKSVKILPDLLAEMYPEMKAAGYRFATPSMLR